MGDTVHSNVSIEQKQSKMICVISHSLVLSVIEAFQSTTRKIIGCFHNGRGLTNAQSFIQHHCCRHWELWRLLLMPCCILIATCFSDSVPPQWRIEHFNLLPVESYWNARAKMRGMIWGEAESRGFGEGVAHADPLTRPAFASTCLLTVRDTQRVSGGCKSNTLSRCW